MNSIKPKFNNSLIPLSEIENIIVKHFIFVENDNDTLAFKTTIFQN
jgi:hypothetical protein